MRGRHALLHRAGASLLAFVLALILVLVLAGCASNAENMASASSDQPWTPRGDEETVLWSLSRADRPTPEDGAANFSIPADAARAQLALIKGVDPERTYRLPELIDLAQRTNPATRAAWQQARQAALAVGMVEATYLPVITASVIGGYQELTTPLPDVLGENLSFDTTEQGTAQILALQWLVFDFGQRQALAAAAKHTAIAANVLFNGSHQKLIFDVSKAYYVYGAALQRRGFAETALRNAEAVQAAIEARQAQGLATSVEAAQARQAVAQAELRRVQADGEERDAYQNLLAAVGVNVTLKVAADEFQRVQTAAVTEIVAARNALRTALESHRAAKALVAAASTTYDAALAAYRNGVGTVDAATAADTALLDAREAQADAHAAALIGAVNLAFVVGALTSQERLP